MAHESSPSPAAPVSTAEAALAAVHEASRNLAELRQQLGDWAGHQSAHQTREAELEARAAALQAAQQEIDSRRQELERRAADLADTAQEISLKHESAARALTERIAAREAELGMALAEASRLRAELDQRTAESQREADVGKRAGIEAAKLELRRARLRRQRELLAERVRQLITANEAIAARAAEFETQAAQNKQIADERAALRQRAFELDERARQLSSSAAASGKARPTRIAVAAVAFASVALGLPAIAASSWWISGMFEAPVTIAATTIGMEPTDETRSAEHIESWQGFTQEILADPRFMEVASERLRRRGHEQLGTPSDVRRRLDADLTIETPAPGELRLSLRGEGEAATRHILETVAATALTLANDGRERRLDKAVTMVINPVASTEAGEGEDRMVAFAMVSGGMLGLAAMAGIGGMSIASRRAQRGSPQSNIAPGNAQGDEEERWTINVE